MEAGVQGSTAATLAVGKGESGVEYWSSLVVQLSFDLTALYEKHSPMALKLVTLGCELAMVFGGVVPYIPQYLQIKQKQTTKGFSLHVCLALLLANTLRIIFWFGKRFETPLLVQSVLMNIAMFALIQLCVSINNKEYLVVEKRKPHVFTDLDPKFFWQWTDFPSYVEFIMVVAVVCSILMFFLIDFSPFVETIGFLAVFTEAMLGVPQFYRNFKNRSTYGMSLSMVMMWTCGDIFKTSYFYVRQTPPQFFICGALQVSVDLCILVQVWLYQENTEKRKRSERLALWQRAQLRGTQEEDRQGLLGDLDNMEIAWEDFILEEPPTTKAFVQPGRKYSTESRVSRASGDSNIIFSKAAVETQRRGDDDETGDIPVDEDEAKVFSAESKD